MLLEILNTKYVFFKYFFQRKHIFISLNLRFIYSVFQILVSKISHISVFRKPDFRINITNCITPKSNGAKVPDRTKNLEILFRPHSLIFII